MVTGPLGSCTHWAFLLKGDVKVEEGTEKAGCTYLTIL
jgi:hypothetical protein